MKKYADTQTAEGIEVGTIVYDVFDEGVRFITMRGPFHWCGYLGIPLDHPLAGFDYDAVPLEAHGGLTFSSKARDVWPEGYWWYGWDYGHSGDRSYFSSGADRDGKDWTIKEVIEDSQNTVWEFKTLMKLAEKIKAKSS